jgi:hypothetical protein
MSPIEMSFIEMSLIEMSSIEMSSIEMSSIEMSQFIGRHRGVASQTRVSHHKRGCRITNEGA